MTGAAGGERVCEGCGEPMASGAAFCRRCGARHEEPEEAAVAIQAVPAACRECGEEPTPGAAFCRSCGTPVATQAPTVRNTEPTTPSPPAVVTSPSTPAAAPPPSSGGSRRARVPLIFGALVLLVGAGAAVAIVATRNSDSTTVTRTIEQTQSAAVVTQGVESRADEAAETEEAPVEPTEEPTAEEEPNPQTEEQLNRSGYPDVARGTMNEEVESVLEGYHADVVEEDFQAAWAMLSPRKRRQDLREDGYGKWTKAQATLSPYLDPYGLEAEIVALEGEGVARVEVSGMGWDAPGASCSEWSGLTWVRYEGDHWAYDPGYSTTTARRAVWRSKGERLLGGDC